MKSRSGHSILRLGGWAALGVAALAWTLVGAAPLPAPALGELLPNPGFEQDADGDGAPDGWGPGRFDTESSVHLDDRVAHGGRRSVRVDGDPKGRAGVSVGFGPERTDAAAVYLLSAWVRIEGSTDSELGTSARITTVGADGGVLKSDYRLCAAGPHDWRHYEWLVALPEGTNRFNLVLFHHGAGTAWWDDVSLRPARPARALAPAQGATVGDGRPTFRWQASPGTATLEITPAEGAALDAVRRYPVTGGEFTLPQALPTGQEYTWRVVTAGVDGGLTVTLAPAAGDAPAEASRFFAGTWEQRMMPLRQKITRYREMLTELQALAQRTGMWDSFSLLADAVAQGEKLLAAEPAHPAKARAELDTALAELEFTAPWWQSVFVDNTALANDLDLERPGLERAKAAAAGRDWPAFHAALRDYYRARKGPSYYARYEDAPRRNPAVTTNKAADALLTHQFSIHDYETPTYDLGRDFNWHVRPIIDIEWPTQIHRHFHWSRIAGAYWETGNDQYAEEIAQELLDWAKDNPMERWDPERMRWAWSTLNATIRIYSSWINAWLQVRDSAAWSADAQFVFLTCLREHGRFLMTHAARQGNWVVAEARGLVELGILFPEFKEAKAWRDEGYLRLQRELAAQVLSDGVHVERTPGYHSMTMGCFMEPVQLGLLNKIEVPGRDEFVAKLEQMHEFYLYGAKPNHCMEQIGDGGMMNVDSMLRRGWSMFRREDMQWVLSSGAEGKPPVHRSYAFGGAGFYVSRSAWNDPNALWSILDWGGFLGHCHEDMGHLSLYAYGTELLIDTGRYSYARPMRLPFYETVGHNTVMVDKKTQSRRDPLSARWVSTDQFDVFTGATDNSEPLTHERTLAFRQPNDAGPGYWLVVDRLAGEGTHRLDQRWHATERLSALAEGDRVVLTGKPDGDPQPSLVIANLPGQGLETAVVEGAVSYEWYKKVPVDVAQFTRQAPAPAGFVTALYPTPPGAPPAQVSLLPVPTAGDATAVAVTIQDRGRTFRDLWLVNHAGEGIRKADDLETDARVAFVREEGGRRSWFLTDGSTLRLGGTLLFSAAGKVAGAGAAPRGAGTEVVCTAGREVRVRVPGQATRNGTPLPAAGADGLVVLGTVADVPVPPVPHAPGGPRFEIEPPEPEPQASSFAALLPAGAGLEDGAVRVEAEAFSGQGGGAVEIAADRVGARGRAFFHWDRAGHWLEWKLPVARAGRYALHVRACGSEARVLRKVAVNGRAPAGAEAVEIAGTGGYSRERDDWRTFVLATLDLPAGDAVIRLENVDGRSLNLDWLALVPHP